MSAMATSSSIRPRAGPIWRSGLRRKPRATSAPTVPAPRIATRTGRFSVVMGGPDWGQRSRVGYAADCDGRGVRRSGMVPEAPEAVPDPASVGRPPLLDGDRRHAGLL